MDCTPKDEESTHVSPFNSPAKIFESTPKTETEITPHFYNNNSKKRKIQYCDIKGRKLDDLLEMCPSTPQSSCMLNESLTNGFENIKIEQNCYIIDDCDEPAPKFLKTNGCDKLVTPPSTPESHLRAFECTPRKSSSFQKCSSACSVSSPMLEKHEILYPILKPLPPVQKPLTPQKFKERIGQNSTPLYAERNKKKNKLHVILNNDVVMGQIFKYLSDGDLFRISMVSRDFRGALNKNTKASVRCSNYREGHKKNKENYKITPPSSPESQSLFPEGSVSPNSQNFAEFVKTGNSLNGDQSLIKCPKCLKPSVVEKSIAQCQDANACGYIYCQKCSCFSYNPNEFYDKCQELRLNSSIIKNRPKLEDLTNCSSDFNNISSILNSTVENLSSGYFSGYDVSHNSLSVKRNLSTSFDVNDSLSKPHKVLFDSNRSLNNSSIVYDKRDEKKKSPSSILPVIKSGTVTKKIEVIEPSSPPKVETYSACSKASKRNLKRLTR